MKRSNIDAMICRQEKLTDITRETINKIQLDKLNAVLKREKERQGFYRDLPERLESIDDLKTLPLYQRNPTLLRKGAGCYCAPREKYRGSFQNRQVEQPVQVNVYFIQKEIVNIPVELLWPDLVSYLSGKPGL